MQRGEGPPATLCVDYEVVAVASVTATVVDGSAPSRAEYVIVSFRSVVGKTILATSSMTEKETLAQSGCAASATSVRTW